MKLSDAVKYSRSLTAQIIHMLCEVSTPLLTVGLPNVFLAAYANSITPLKNSKYGKIIMLSQNSKNIPVNFAAI